jgi:alanyl-tRNA synthetase
VIDSKNNFYVYVKNYDHKNIFHKEVIAKVDYKRRRAIQRNHSATHLVHEALRRVLGSHVKQMGSLVTDEYLRFDFPNLKKLTGKEILRIEEIVNGKILEGIKVNTLKDVSIGEANKIPNVKKFFGEKYGSVVRVVTMDENFSVEFCGGTHVSNTNDIGLFKITKEESISSGVRRIFARTGEGIINLIDEKIDSIENIISELPNKYSNNFKSGLDEFRKGYRNIDFKDVSMMRTLLEYQDATIKTLYDLREKYIEEKKQDEKKLLKQNIGNILNELDILINNAPEENGIKVLACKLGVNNAEEFKELGERLREKILNGVGLVASVIDGKINLVCSVSDNLIKEKNLNAGKLIAEVAKELGGGGGGRPQLATAGGKDVSKLDEALKKFETKVIELVK